MTAASTGTRIRRNPREISGVLLLDKPRGITSNHALQRIKRLYNAKSAGHTGTLDPLATGLLPIALGEATKFSQGLLDADKRYVAVLRLGIRTTTGDAEGEVIEQREVSVQAPEIEPALARWRGEIEQTPPMYSALKVAGRPLYEYARRGQTLDRAPRRVLIHELRCLGFESPALMLEVHCSKGTYVRTLAEDIGNALGCGAHLSDLRRTAIADFSVTQAISLEATEQTPDAHRDGLLRPVDHMLQGLPRIDLEAEDAARFKLGQARSLRTIGATGLMRIYGPAGRFLGVAELSADGTLQPHRVMRI